MTPRSSTRAACLLSTTAVIVRLVAAIHAQSHSAMPAIAVAISPQAVSGVWRYNENESVHASTGKPETARAVNDRVGVGDTVGKSVAGRGSYDPDSMYANFMDAFLLSRVAEERATLRDLLEIPQWLRIDVTTDAVSIIDDLDRPLIFPVDGKRRKYQLGAAMFDAKAMWSGNQLKIDIEGRIGPTVTEILFVNEPGSKLFQVIRVSAPPGDRDQRPTGINRVYDREK